MSSPSPSGLRRLLHVAPSLGLFLLGQVAASCRPTAPPPQADRQAPTTELLPADRVSDLDHPERPTLRLVRRDGDPVGAVAVALFPDGGSRSVLALTALLETRLETGFSLTPHSIGLVIAIEAGDGEQARQGLSTVRAALEEPVLPGDPALLRADELLGTLRTSVDQPSAVGACLTQLGSEGRAKLGSEPLTASEVETARRSANSAQRTGLAALGPKTFLEVVAASHQGVWETGTPLLDADEQPTSVAVVPGPAPGELRVALRMADQPAALAASRALRRLHHPARARLRAVDDDLRLLSVRTQLRPGGACLAASVVSTDTAHPPSVSTLAPAALALADELNSATRDAQSSDESTLALLGLEDPLEAAGLAAWTAVSASGKEAPASRLIEYARPSGTAPTEGGFKAALSEFADELAAAPLSLKLRVEGGQAEAWLLAATSCGTFSESADQAGLRALTVRSLAADFSGREGVTLEPWVMADAVGLLAHGAPLRNESPEHHAARLARVIGLALAGSDLDGRDVAHARSSQLDLVGNDPGRDAALAAVAGGPISWLSPLGSERSIAPLSTADVIRARGEIASEPMRLALIANHGTSQGPAASIALSNWLAPLRRSATKCPLPAPQPKDPGLWTIETVEQTVGSSAQIAIPAQGPREIGKATEWLLNRPGGYLESALLSTSVVDAAQATWLGSDTQGALLIELQAAGGKLDEAVAQTRALLAQLARGAMPAVDAALARAEQVRREQRVKRSPRGRVVRLWLGGDTIEVTADALRQLHTQFNENTHRIVRVRLRK